MRVASGGEAVATLASARGQDRAAGARAHPEAEAVGLVTATVVGLEGALAHVNHSTQGADRRRHRNRVGTCEARQLDEESTGTARPRDLPGGRACRGHAAPVDTDSTCQRYGQAGGRVKPAVRPGPTGPPRAVHRPSTVWSGPVEERLIHRVNGCYRPPFRSSSPSLAPPTVRRPTPWRSRTTISAGQRAGEGSRSRGRPGTHDGTGVLLSPSGATLHNLWTKVWITACQHGVPHSVARRPARRGPTQG